MFKETISQDAIRCLASLIRFYDTPRYNWRLFNIRKERLRKFASSSKPHYLLSALDLFLKSISCFVPFFYDDKTFSYFVFFYHGSCFFFWKMSNLFWRGFIASLGGCFWFNFEVHGRALRGVVLAVV